MPKIQGDVIIRFDAVTFEYSAHVKTLDEASFTVREGSKITLMGQNGAGKTTIFNLIQKKIGPTEGTISVRERATIGTAEQTIPREWLPLTVREFFEKAFLHSTSSGQAGKKVYDIDPRIAKVLDAVNLKIPTDRKVQVLSGGQQARLLLAFALIQNPDILLLDEPTNNLDKAGIEHLTKFLIDYEKTLLVISHDAGFLNAFSDGVLYLDTKSHKIEQYAGNYFDVVAEISRRIERERALNVRLEKEIQHRKDQANFFAQKGGKMRDVARKMWEKIEELEEDIVDVREEDKAIRTFTIPSRTFPGPIVELTSVQIMKDHKFVTKKIEKLVLKKGDHLLLTGPNGIGKTTLLESLATEKMKGATITEGVKIGFYRQDFSTLSFEDTAYKVLSDVMESGSEERLRSVAAQFLISAGLLKNKVKDLSEGQKGLLSFARLVLLEPDLLLLDEPTNHINFRHLPAIAEAIKNFRGALILVSHMKSFVEDVNIKQTLDLGAL